MSRYLVWFSCGAPSAVAAKLAIGDYGKDNVVVVNCDTKPSEHPDNYRFFNEVQSWLGVKITEIRSDKYVTVEDVVSNTRYMSGIKGARCTTELKKVPRMRFANPDDTHIFGMTYDEESRALEFQHRNPDLILDWILLKYRYTRAKCIHLVKTAGILEPMMYRLGFNNNNCPGCLKATSPWYWDMIRTHFPDTFKSRCQQSREIGCKLVRVDGERIFLDELPAGPFKKSREHISCGPECGLQLGVT